MESEAEAGRLLAKSEYGTTKEQLLATGLKPGFQAADAGGGAGFVTKIMAEIVGEAGHVTLIDQASKRLDAAKAYCKEFTNISYLSSDLEKIALEGECFDYLFCRFVFEYLREPQMVFDELYRLIKPGGKLVIGDLDYNVLSHHPLPSELEINLREIAEKLEKLKVWDPYAGRKLYRMFYHAGLRSVRVHMIPHHLIYGEARRKDIENWQAKIDQLEAWQKEGKLSLSFSMEKFGSDFMKFFKSPDRFSYSPLFLVEGQKPHTN